MVWNSSLVAGQMSRDALKVEFTVKGQDGTPNPGASLQTEGWYAVRYAVNADQEELQGTDKYTKSQVVVDGGEGNDIIVLNSKDLKNIVTASAGDDMLVGFESGVDKLNLSNFLNANKALTTTAVAAGLVDNAVAILGSNAAAETGIFSATEVQALIDTRQIAFNATAADGATGVVFLQDTSLEGSNVYTIVQVINGATVSWNIMGSITLDKIPGVALALTVADFTLDNVLVYANRVSADSYAQLAGTGTTIFLPTDAANICTGISTETLQNVNSQPITELHGGFADDSFVISGDITNPLTIYGEGGSDSFVIGKDVTIDAPLHLVGDSDSSELSLKFADSVQVASGKLSIFFDGEGSDPLGFDVVSNSSGGLDFTFDSVPDNADNSLSITGTGKDDTFTLKGLSSLGSVSLDGGDGDDTLVISMTREFNDIAVTLDMTQIRNIEQIVIKGDYGTTKSEPVTLDLSQTDAGVVLNADVDSLLSVYRPIYVTTHPAGSTLYLNGGYSNGNRITLTISQDPDTGEYIAADNLIQYFCAKGQGTKDVMDLSRLGIGEAGDPVDFFAKDYTAGSFLNASGKDVLLLGKIAHMNNPEYNLQAVKNINWVNDPDLAGAANTILVDQTCLVIISEGTNSFTNEPQPYRYCGMASFYLAVSDDSGVELVGLGSFALGQGQNLSGLGADNFSL